MNAADRSELLQVLQGRCDTIAGSWYQAIARTSFPPHSAAKVRQRLIELTEQTIAFLLANPLERGRAEAIGASLARLHYIEPKVLSRTLELLVGQLVEGLPADHVVALQPRLAALLGGLATGFFQQARKTILTEPEQIRGALTSDLRLRTLDCLPDYICVKDAKSQFVLGDIALGCHIEATTPDEPVGKTDSDFYPQEPATRDYADEQEIIRSGQPLINQEELVVDEATGDKRWQLTSKVPVRSSCGEIVGIVGLTRDITECRRMEDELLCSQEEMLRNHRLLLALSQAAQAVQRARTTEEVYRTIGDEATGLGYYAMVFALTDDREHITCFHTTFGPALLRTVEELSGLSLPGFRFSLAPDGLFRRIIAEGESAFCESTAEIVAKGVPELGRALIERLIATLGIAKSVYAPLKVGGETHGLLVVASTDLTEADAPAVTAFANQAGIAIENAQLLEQVVASRERLRWLARQIVSAQEEERRRLSRALHSKAGQSLTVLKISLELIREDLPVEFDSLRQRLGDVADLATTTMEQIRSLAQDLRPPALDALGLGPILESFCRDFAGRTGLCVDYLGLELPVLPEAVNTCLYRFLQETLTNVAKHACADQVCVALRCDAETVSLSVEDDGRGFDKRARLSVSGRQMGVGLLGMQEWLESLGGRLEIESRPGQGTRLVAHLPPGSVP